MLRIAVFSDTHGTVSHMLEAVRFSQPDILVHLGDFASDAEILRERFPTLPLYAVRGNTDRNSCYPDCLTVSFGPVRAFLTHGHLQDAEYSRMRLCYAALEQECALVLFGHTHIPLSEELNGIRLVNPGTAGKGHSLSWALLTVDEDSSVDVSLRPLPLR